MPLLCLFPISTTLLVLCCRMVLSLNPAGERYKLFYPKRPTPPPHTFLRLQQTQQSSDWLVYTDNLWGYMLYYAVCVVCLSVLSVIDNGDWILAVFLRMYKYLLTVDQNQIDCCFQYRLSMFCQLWLFCILFLYTFFCLIFYSLFILFCISFYIRFLLYIFYMVFLVNVNSEKIFLLVLNYVYSVFYSLFFTYISFIHCFLSSLYAIFDIFCTFLSNFFGLSCIL